MLFDGRVRVPSMPWRHSCTWVGVVAVFAKELKPRPQSTRGEKHLYANFSMAETQSKANSGHKIYFFEIKIKAFFRQVVEHFLPVNRNCILSCFGFNFFCDWWVSVRNDPLSRAQSTQGLYLLANCAFLGVIRGSRQHRSKIIRALRSLLCD